MADPSIALSQLIRLGSSRWPLPELLDMVAGVARQLTEADTAHLRLAGEPAVSMEPGLARLSVPLGPDGAPLGSLDLGWKSPGEPSAPHAELAATLAAYAAILIDNQRAHARESERTAELQSIIEQMPSGVIVIDGEGQVRLRNPAGERISGWQGREQVMDLPTYVAILPDTGQEMAVDQAPLVRALRGDRVEAFDYILRKPNGEEVTVRSSAAPLRDGEGAISGAVMVYSDVTRERQLAAELAASEARLRALYDTVVCGVIVRGPDGRFLYANRMAWLLLGSPRARGGSDPFEGWTQTGADGQILPATAATERVRSGQPVRDEPLHLISPAGEERWFLVNGVPMFEDGEVHEVVFSFVDVTEGHKAQRSLDARARQQAAVASLGQLALKVRQPQDVMEHAVRLVCDTLGVDSAYVGQLGAQPSELRIAAFSGGIDPIPLVSLAVDSATTRALASDQPFIVEDYQRQAELDRPRDTHGREVRSCLSMPIHLDAGLLGALALFSNRPRAFSQDDVHFVAGVANVIGSAVDRALARDALAANEARYRRIIETSQEGIWTIDLSGRTAFANETMAAMLGCTLDELMASSMYDFVSLADREELAEDLRQSREGDRRRDFQLLRKDRRPLWTSLSTSPLLDEAGKVTGVLAMLADITDRKHAEEALTHQALHDALTGLPNRTLLHDRLDQAIRGAARDGRPLSIMILDLDGFKYVNDTLGHDSGDQLLCDVGPRLETVLRRSDTVARLGGDEFAIILPGIGSGEEVGVVAQKILRTFERPFNVAGHEMEVGVSIGIAVYPEHGDDVASLLRLADVAMYRAKQQRNSYAIYSAATDQPGEASLLLLSSELRRGLDTGELELFYQPKLAAAGTLVGAEALARWRHPTRGLLPASQFIPVAERSGLIRPLGDWAIAQALRQLRQWQDEGLPLSLAVNLSMRDLRDPHLIQTIADLLGSSGVQPSALELEITETAIMADPDQTMAVVTELHGMGLTFSIDDFGTGYSSLSYLKALPASEIKIDRGFVADLLTDEHSATIVKSVVDLAHNLGRVTVAEGVESAQSWEALMRMGCDVGQGYWIGRPMPAADFAAWLRQSTWRLPSKRVPQILGV